jgi:hypothetical protein
VEDTDNNGDYPLRMDNTRLPKSGNYYKPEGRMLEDQNREGQANFES